MTEPLPLSRFLCLPPEQRPPETADSAQEHALARWLDEQEARDVAEMAEIETDEQQEG